MPSLRTLEALRDEAQELADLPRARVIIDLLCTMVLELSSQVEQLRRARFGRSSEQLAAQGTLFPEAVAVPLPPEPTETVSFKRKVAKGRPALPKDLPRQRVEHELPTEERVCPCGQSMVRIGEDSREMLDYIPAKLIVVEHVRHKYACPCGKGGVKLASMPALALEKANAGAGLQAQVLVAKYEDHLPLARQSRIFGRQGVAIARQTLCDMVLGSTELLSAMLPILKQALFCSPVIHADDTILPLIEEESHRTAQARVWAYVSREVAYFEFTDTREGKHPQRFLEDYRGYLQADAFAGFDALFAHPSTGKTEIACWAHVRRKYFEIAEAEKKLKPDKPTIAMQALAWIAKLYAIEAQHRSASPEQRHRARLEESAPVLSQFERWLNAQANLVPPKAPIGLAIGYALNNWKALVRYLEDPCIEIDNNRVERALRPVALGRKNFLFVASERGGRAAAIAYSLIETAKLHRVEPLAYLTHLLTRLPNHTVNRLHELLPGFCGPLPRMR